MIYTAEQKDYTYPMEVKSYWAADMISDHKERQREQMYETLERLYERIFEHRHELRLAYAQKANSYGIVPLVQWGRVLRDITKYWNRRI